jgi:hypothetical protein
MMYVMLPWVYIHTGQAGRGQPAYFSSLLGVDIYTQNNITNFKSPLGSQHFNL